MGHKSDEGRCEGMNRGGQSSRGGGKKLNNSYSQQIEIANDLGRWTGPVIPNRGFHGIG